MRFFSVLFLVLALGLWPARALAAVVTLPEALAATAANVRSVGTAGARQSADYFSDQLTAATGMHVFRQRFELAVPILDQAEARAGDVAYPIFPLMPAGGQIPFIAGGQMETEIVYAGRGTLEEIKGKPIARRWIALELESGDAWKQLADLGASGVLFLSDGHAPATAFLDKQTQVPIGLPRFYTQELGLVTGLRGGIIKELKLSSRAHWEARIAENMLVFIPARRAVLSAADPITLLSARYDATSQVLGLSPGAKPAANAAGVVMLAEKITAMPEHGSVLIALTAGDEYLLAGTRHMQAILQTGAKDGAHAVAALQARLKDASETSLHMRATAAALNEFILSGGGAVKAKIDGALAEALRDELDRSLSQLDDQLQRARLAAGDPAADAEVKRLAEAKSLRIAASAALQRVDVLADPQWELLHELAGGIVAGWSQAAQRAEMARQELEQEIRFRSYLGDRGVIFHFGIELTAGAGATARFGLFDRSSYLHSDDYASHIGDVDRVIRRDAEGLGKEALNRYVPETLNTLPTLESWFPVPRAFSTDISLASGLPAATFATVQDAGTAMDTPADTAAAFNVESFLAQWNQVALLLAGDRTHAGLVGDAGFRGRSSLRQQTDSQTIRLVEQTLADASPRLGTGGALLGAWQERSLGTSALLPAMQGTRAFDFQITQIDGSATFTGLLKSYYPLQGFTFNADGSVARALAQTQANITGLTSLFAPDSEHPLRAMLFDASRLDLFALFDPRYGEYLDHITLLDARRRDELQTSSQFLNNGLAAIFFPPGTRWQLLASRGDVGNRMVLIHATPANPDGDGFDSTAAADIGPLAWRTANDLALLDAKRKSDLEHRGISSELIRDLRASAESHLSAGETSRVALDYAGWRGHASAAWAFESQAYADLISTSNGIIYGVIFLLLAIIPFSYFLERLLFGFTHIYKQIGAFAGIFALMTGGLWFHPAFRISAAPMMILLAFFILILSSLVVFMLFGKFEEEIARLRGAADAAHSVSLRRAAVLGAAIRLGLSNMRRRAMRTGLTLLTLVLLTFTLLCFTSVRESIGLVPRVVSGAPKDTPPGILLKNSAWHPLPAEMIELARSAAGEEGVVAERWWLTSENPETMLLLPVRKGNAAVNARDLMAAAALLGLDASEASFHAVELEKILPGWSRLAAGENVCLLPISAQAGAAVKVNDEVTLAGHTLIVAGFFNPNGLSDFRQMTGDSMMPANSTSAGDQTAHADQPSARAEPRQSFVDPQQVAIVPIPLVRQLGGHLTSLIFRPKNSAAILPVAQTLARQTAFSIVAADADSGQVRSYNAAASATPENLDRVLVPMILAGIIVLNTMLGAVAERSREIHVYTSLGLAPSHVATLFLAEAAALGTLGVVFGYIFGQGLATVLSYFHLLQGVELNYSSTGALITVSLVLGVVMLSAIWPARAASRIAAPSLQREWKLPRPVGDILQVELPFTVNAEAARGICAFLEEHFASVTQTGAARFTTDALKTFASTAAATPQATPVRGFHCRVWLAPYDLGVIQNFWLAIHPTQDAHVFEVHLTLIREAGSPSAWLRLNRPFLTEVRKQFLLWRALVPEAMHEYVVQSARLFAHAELTGPPTGFEGGKKMANVSDPRGS